MPSISQPPQYYFNIQYQDALRALTNSFVEIPVQIQGSTINVPITGYVSIANNLNPLSITGSVSVNNFPSIQPITGSVNVGNLPTVQPITGNIGINNFPYNFDTRLGAIYGQLEPSNTNLFTSNLTSQAYGYIVAKLSANVTGVLSLIYQPNGQLTSVISTLTTPNPGNNFLPNTWYDYVFSIGQNDSINFQINTTGTINLYVDFKVSS